MQNEIKKLINQRCADLYDILDNIEEVEDQSYNSVCADFLSDASNIIEDGFSDLFYYAKKLQEASTAATFVRSEWPDYDQVI